VPDPPREVDPRAFPAELRTPDRASARDLRCDEGEVLEPVDLVGQLADDVARVRDEVRVADVCVDRLQRIGPEDQVGQMTPGVDLGRREHDLARVALDRQSERVVLGGRPILAELHVVGDRLRAVLRDLVDRLRVELARERKTDVEIGERLRVDPDDDHVLRRAPSSANREACVDRLALEVVEDPEPVGEQDDADRADPDGEEEGVPQTLLAARAHR